MFIIDIFSNKNVKLSTKLFKSIIKSCVAFSITREEAVERVSYQQYNNKSKIASKIIILNYIINIIEIYFVKGGEDRIISCIPVNGHIIENVQITEIFFPILLFPQGFEHQAFSFRYIHRIIYQNVSDVVVNVNRQWIYQEK